MLKKSYFYANDSRPSLIPDFIQFLPNSFSLSLILLPLFCAVSKSVLVPVRPDHVVDILGRQRHLAAEQKQGVDYQNAGYEEEDLHDGLEVRVVPFLGLSVHFCRSKRGKMSLE